MRQVDIFSTSDRKLDSIAMCWLGTPLLHRIHVGIYIYIYIIFRSPTKLKPFPFANEIGVEVVVVGNLLLLLVPLLLLLSA